jgi:hypothetical protein
MNFLTGLTTASKQGLYSMGVGSWILMSFENKDVA